MKREMPPVVPTVDVPLTRTEVAFILAYVRPIGSVPLHENLVLKLERALEEFSK